MFFEKEVMMSSIRYFLFCIILFSFPSITSAAQPAKSEKISHVIYVTLDGVRWQDIFLDSHPYFNKFWEKHANSLTIYGAPDSHTTMETASVPVSLPSYHTQLSGVVSPCTDNDCGRINIETFPENILFKLKLAKKDVATFASWDSIGLAAEHIPGTTLVNEGNIPMEDPVSHRPDDVMRDINHQQEVDSVPGSSDRYDRYTYAQAIHYFQKYQPTFMWVSLDDADSAAHDRDIDAYHKAIDFYDYAIDNLFLTLKLMCLDKNTLVIITADHGRGNGEHWNSHGVKYPESKQTWAFVMNGELKLISEEGDVKHFNTLSIRPTIERALGVG